MRLPRLFIISSLVVAGAIYFAAAPTAHADIQDMNVETGCGSASVPYYTGVLNPPKDTYDVYVKLGKMGQTAKVSGYVRFNDGSTSCGNIGTIDASGNEWRKLGSYADIDGDAETILQLSASVLVGLPDANRPSLMLVSQTRPVCVPTTECVTTIDEQAAYVRPAGTALQQNGLHVVRVSPIDTSLITRVQYFVDNELLYETNTLQNFRNVDIPFYANRLIRVVHFTSGQIAVLETSAPYAAHDDPWSLVQRFVKKYQNTLIAIGVVLALIICIRLSTLVARYLERRHQWRLSHGFIHSEADTAVTPAQIRRLHLHNKIRIIYRYVVRTIMMIVPVILVIMVVTTSFIQVGTVSGRSMWSTLQDGQKIIINKAPVTFARLNNSLYVPARGDIVVASPNFGTIDMSLEQDNESLIIKRVIGLPGERVVVNGSLITVYNKEHPEGLNPDVSVKWAGNIQHTDSKDHIEVTLAENEVFLCGDNRPGSIDSRFNGPITTNQLIGVIVSF